MRKLLTLVLFMFYLVLQGESEEIRVYILTNPVSNQRVLPNEPISVPTYSEILITATPGEYEPGSFVLNSKRDIEQVEIEASDLKSKEGKIINSSSIDIKLVKCWYQDKGIGYKEKTPANDYNPIKCNGEKVLVPELLLNDDNLIKVDYEKRKNFIKINTEIEEKYIDISVGKSLEEIEKQIPEGYDKYNGKLLVQDSDKLLPFQLKKNENKQVWLTIKVPENQKEGIYEGNIKIKSKGSVLTTIPLKVNILPFKLGSSHRISSIFYTLPLQRDYGENIWEQFRKEMENLLSHGVTNPTYRGQPTTQDLKIRQEIGMENQSLFLSFYTPYPFYENLPIKFTQEDIEMTKKNVKNILEITNDFEIKNVYFYGWDEVIGERLVSQKPVWEAIHQAGGKVFAASYKRNVEFFSLVGDILDLFVCGFYPSKEEAENWHSKGHKIVSYSNPQGGIEAPDTYRRNYGILLWQYDYDGAMTYTYTYPYYSFAQVWSESTGRYKAHNMVYPTGNGVIDTLQWEGYREGIDDVRYLNILIEETKRTKNEKIKKQVEEFLTELKKGDINRDIENMDCLRLKIINYIIELKQN